MSGNACAATPPANGIAFADPGPIAAAAMLTAPNRASVANFICSSLKTYVPSLISLRSQTVTIVC